MITIRFDKLYSIDRIAEPCSVSIPLAAGRLYETGKVCLKQNGRNLPVQKKVLASYPDGSVKYLFLRFPVDIPANRGTEVVCSFAGEEERPSHTFDECSKCTSELTCLKTENGYEVSTGAVRFTVCDGTGHLFQAVRAGEKNYDQEQFVGPMLKKGKDGNSCGLLYGSWTVEEEGPVAVVLSNQGRFAEETGIQCETRVMAYVGKAAVDVEFRLINASEEAFGIAAWEFSVEEPCPSAAWIEETGMLQGECCMKDSKTEKSCDENRKIRTCAAESNYKTGFLISEDGEAVEKQITAEFLLNQSNEHFGETFHGTFFADRTADDGGVCATIYQAHQNFPKAVLARTDGITVKLIPEGSSPIPLQSGMAISQKFQLYFHDAKEDLQRINHQSIQYQMPDRPVLDCSVYEDSGLFPDIFVPVERQDGEVEAALMAAADIHTRSYGMMNWGDAPDPNYTAQGRGQGRQVWTNNEYDYPHACMLQFARTGIRRYLDYCLVSGTHQRDVDICHYSTNELHAGGQWEHTKGHCLDGEIVCSHQWVEGLLDCYHMSGDERFFDAAIGIGENILRLLDTPVYQKAGGLNARETGWALRTLTALYKETYEERWTAKSDWIVGQFVQWSEIYGGWLAPYTDNTMIRVPFMISVAVGSLMRHYREFPQERIRNMILHAVDDMIEHCYMRNGYFVYKELPSLSRVGNNPLVLEALAIAFELTGDRRYLSYGKKTF